MGTYRDETKVGIAPLGGADARVVHPAVMMAKRRFRRGEAGASKRRGDLKLSWMPASSVSEKTCWTLQHDSSGLRWVAERCGAASFGWMQD